MEQGGQKGEARRGSTVPLNINYKKKCPLRTPMEESSAGKDHHLQAPKGKGVHCISYKTQTTPAAHPVSNPHGHVLSSTGLLFKTTPPNFLLLSQKITFVSFICWAGLWFCHTCMSQNTIFCYSQINPFLLGKELSFLKFTNPFPEFNK